MAWPIILTLFSSLICVGLYLGVKNMPELTAGAIGIASVFGLMTVGVWYFIWKRNVDGAFWLQISGMVVFSIVLMTLVFPKIAYQFESKEIAHEFLAKYDQKSPVYIAKPLHPGFTFYSDVYGKELVPSEVPQLIASHEKVFFVLREGDYGAISNMDRQKLTILAVTADKKYLLVKP